MKPEGKTFLEQLCWNWPDHRRDYDSFIVVIVCYHVFPCWNWPDHRRDYDVNVCVRSLTLVSAGIDLITEGITTVPAMVNGSNNLRGWNWPDHRRDYDCIRWCIREQGHQAGIDLITEGITTLWSCHCFQSRDAGIDLITEGITTIHYLSLPSIAYALELTWSQKGLRPLPPVVTCLIMFAGIDLITEGITTLCSSLLCSPFIQLELTWSQKGLRRSLLLPNVMNAMVCWNWPDHRRDYDDDMGGYRVEVWR